MTTISKLQFITTNAALAEKACIGGVDWIQLRLKNVSYADHYAIAQEVKAVCREFGATFIINDNVALAIDAGADGVHLGQKDMAPDTARSLAGQRFIIGSTANTFEDVARLSHMPINYIGLGPFRYTATKENLSPVLGINGYRSIFEQLHKEDIKYPPVIGIGGITLNDVTALMQTGLYGIAVSGAISAAADVTGAAIAFKRLLGYE